MTALGDLPPLREVIRAHGLDARKSLGQNFLLDLNLTAKIARAGGPLEGTTIVEIGPGPGGLTRSLLAEGAAHVIAVEKDARCLPALEEIGKACPGRLTVVEGDALAVDLGNMVRGPARIVANLPYNVGTALLTGWLSLESWPPWFSSLTLMFQREVAERIVARKGDDHYGRLAVLAGWRARSRILFDVPPQAFTPPPKIMSSVVRLEPLAVDDDVSPRLLSHITQAAFGQRRKMLRASLKSLGMDTGALLDEAGIDPTKRAEEIDIDGFLALARAFSRQSHRA
ncbi:MAG: 16S rRNA (adenine(1518)-N(6)/adenine(1519)-N(6))-dimethyltransferase RsmA [Rhodobiaceae bacterium]|nr:16S rRNA (adenine(1518)-N(6)/adenine(1519)-N(6))-dimethyltransferase RsmA [Rhodobiaceae bacterium]MCC0056505.1 16S rRNA (adenine(1518)-N(6)/adenine(1519)-N(6))-dimethyltransferase RsmA [Rhodobiaceae bacterium]